MGIVNAITGKSPGPEEKQALLSRAVEIFRNPYASPEQMEWAINVYPEGFALAFGIRPKPWETREKEGMSQ